MDTKLTLRLDKAVIEKAKEYAAAKQVSLSRMIESYLRAITEHDETTLQDDVKISSFVKSLSSDIDIPSDYDYKQDYKSHLSEKYK